MSFDHSPPHERDPRHHFESIDCSLEEYAEIVAWCEAQFGLMSEGDDQRWFCFDDPWREPVSFQFSFQRESDALAFKARWG